MLVARLLLAGPALLDPGYALARVVDDVASQKPLAGASTAPRTVLRYREPSWTPARPRRATCWASLVAQPLLVCGLKSIAWAHARWIMGAMDPT